MIVSSLVGNVLLGVAVWRSRVLPRVAGALWMASALLFYLFGLVVGLFVTHNSPVTEPIAAAFATVGGVWMAAYARRGRSTAGGSTVSRTGGGASVHG